MLEFLGSLMPTARLAAVGLLLIADSVLALLSLHLLILTAASFLAARGPLPAAPPTRRFAVLIPAHNEELLLGTLLASLRALDYPAALYSVHVVADNCSDGTAEIARRGGAHVYERHDPAAPGKGHALNWLVGRVLAMCDVTDRPDAFVILDADSVVSANYLREMNAGLCAGRPLLQGFNAVANPDESWAASLRHIALCLICYLRPLGKTALGLSTGLYGNGMCLSRHIVEQFPWNPQAPSEDHELHTRLLAAGLKVSFVPAAHVYSQMPTSLRMARSQNARWERGKLELLRRDSPRLLLLGLRSRKWSPIDGALELAIPPFSLAFGLAFAALAAGVVLRSAPAIGLGLFAVVAQSFYTLRGLAIMPIRSSRIYLALVYAPWFVIWKVGVYVAVALGAGKGQWVRTARLGTPDGAQ